MEAGQCRYSLPSVIPQKDVTIKKALVASKKRNLLAVWPFKVSLTEYNVRVLQREQDLLLEENSTLREMIGSVENVSRTEADDQVPQSGVFQTKTASKESCNTHTTTGKATYEEGSQVLRRVFPAVATLIVHVSQR